MGGLKNESRLSGPDVVLNVGKGTVALGHSGHIPILHDHGLLFRVEFAPTLLPNIVLIQIVGKTSVADLMIDGIEYVIERMTPVRSLPDVGQFVNENSIRSLS